MQFINIINQQIPESVPYQEETNTWVKTDFASADLGDDRLNKRLRTILNSFSLQPNASIPQASVTWAKTKAVYRLLNNEKISDSQILSPHQTATISRIQEKQVVLAVQDTTYLNYTHHPATQGLGPIGKSSETLQGMVVHTTLAFTPERVPLGLIHQQTWVRPPHSPDKKSHKNKPIQEKESQKWLNSINATEAVQKESPHTLIINVGDREADIYEVFQQASANHSHILIRAAWDRKVDHPQENLWPYLESKPIAALLDITVPRKKNKPERIAQLELRFDQVTLKPPQRHTTTLPPITLSALYVNESAPPQGEEPVSWLILTTLPVESTESAITYVQYYAVRFSIELFFKMLKSGCQIEKHQLKTAVALRLCLALDSVVAWRVLFLTMLGRSLPDLPCTILFEEHEWKSLYCVVHKTKIPPSTPPSLGEATRLVARLGGFLNRKGDGQPGIKTLWRGLQNLYFVSLSWKAFGPESG